MADTVGMKDIRGENITKAVTGFALQEYKFKSLCVVQRSAKWKETYFVENASDLTGAATTPVEGVPRLSVFPYAEVGWTETSSRHKKYGMETRISWEDKTTNDVDVIARSLIRVARAITKAVDDEIWDTLTESRTVVNINTEAIAAGSEWDSATVANRDPIQDILNARKRIGKNNYSTSTNTFLLLSETDYANILGNANVRNAGQFYTASVTEKGKIEALVGLKIIVSNSVTDDYAAVVIAKEAATWKEVNSLTVRTIEDPGIGYTIRAWEIGTCQLKIQRQSALSQIHRLKMTAELRKKLGKEWKKGENHGDYKDYYTEFKNEIDKELGVSEIPKNSNKKFGGK